jgi:hypothetical protein
MPRQTACGNDRLPPNSDQGSLPFSEVAGGRTCSRSPTRTTKIIIEGERGICWLVTPCGTIPQPVSENDRPLLASSGVTKRDTKRDGGTCTSLLYTILVIVDTSRKGVLEVCRYTYNLVYLPQSGDCRSRSYESSTEPAYFAHPFRVVSMFISHQYYCL